MNLKKIFLGIVCFIFAEAKAQVSINRSANVTVNINSFMSLDFVSNGNLDFKFNTNDELANGILMENKFRARIISNQNWILNMNSLTSNFLSIGTENNTAMPPSILTFRIGGTTNFIPLSNSPTVLKSGSKGNQFSAGNDFNIDIKATPGYNFSGGAYALITLFTLSAQ
jgi:hypothetical protein